MNDDKIYAPVTTLASRAILYANANFNASMHSSTGITKIFECFTQHAKFQILTNRS